ncbi:hypothetical protein EEB15_28460 [Ramlibacter sp. WS9]|nr:hypothetical protein EEB15_28460 [Ramlibacter sp. WS9]
MRLSDSKIAGLLFAGSALGPLGVWAILLFAAVPSTQTAFDNALAMLRHVFTDVSWPERAFFILLAILPVYFAVLAIHSWRRNAKDHAGRIWRYALGFIATALAVVACWPVAIISLAATYYGGKRGEV